MELLLLGLLPILAFGLFGSDDNNSGSGGDDSGSGDPQVDQIIRDGDGQSLLDGGEGNDLMLGAGGRDDMSGDAGTDILVGETGPDTLSGGAGDDLVLGGWGADLLFGGIGSDVVIGGTNDDTLSGGPQDDLLFGSSGADSLDGDDGDDLLIGMEVRQDLSAEDLLEIDTSGLTDALRDIYGDRLTESDENRVLTGVFNLDASNLEPDTLDGGAGADTLMGDNGDVLQGGDGDDEYVVYTEANDTYVSILDFEAARESLVLLVDGPATGTITYSGNPDGVAVLLDGDFVAFLERVAVSDLVAGSITLESLAA